MKTFLIILVFFSCIANAQEINPTSKISSEVLQEGPLKQALLTFITDNGSKLNNLTLNGTKINFDFNNLSILKSDGIFTNVVTSNEMKESSDNSSGDNLYDGKLTLGFITDNGKVMTYSITQTINNGKEKILKYFNEDVNLIYTVNIDESNEEVSVVKNDLLTNERVCGTQTMNCITHHYSRRGWWSVGLWIATGFYPGVGVAVAAACGATCCLNIACPGN
jgi:hypothetical protein